MAPPRKVFETIPAEPALVVFPVAAKSSYRYQDVHLESNAVVRELEAPEFRHLVLDLARIDYANSVLIGAMVRMARQVTEDGGRATFCCVSEKMDDILRKMGLFKLWSCSGTREEALTLVGSED
ncbi:MAG: STAS domain-containing protein [Planctomycetaceae bacterium]|nr:STAS domain-containing protein [Planctomycetaceae bacterium]